MKRRDYTQTIPERIVAVTDYVADDGKVFRSPDACLEYEKKLNERLRIESHPVFKSRRDLRMWPDEESASLYYLSSKDDYLFLKHDMMHLDDKELHQDDFSKFGAGYYILVRCDGGDGPDWYYLHYVPYYIHLIDTEWSNWKDEIERLQTSIMRGESFEV